MKALVLAGFLAGPLLLAGCGGGDDDDQNQLQPADDVRAATVADEFGQAASVGDPVELDDTTVTVSATEWVSREGYGAEEGDWLLVTVRIENPGTEEEYLDFTVECSTGIEGARYVYEGTGAFDPLTVVPAGSFDEGDILFGFEARCGEMIISANETGAFIGDGPVTGVWAGPQAGEPTRMIEG